MSHTRVFLNSESINFYGGAQTEASASNPKQDGEGEGTQEEKQNPKL